MRIYGVRCIGTCKKTAQPKTVYSDNYFENYDHAVEHMGVFYRQTLLIDDMLVIITEVFDATLNTRNS